MMPGPQRFVRAYETELKMYDAIKRPIAFALNNIKQQVPETSLRGFESPLAQH